MSAEIDTIRKLIRKEGKLVAGFLNKDQTPAMRKRLMDRHLALHAAWQWTDTLPRS
jgi:hypothetical protein